MSEIKFSGQLTLKDYRKMIAFASRKMWIIVLVCVIFMAIMGLWDSDLKSIRSTPLSIFLSWLPILIFVPVVMIFQYFGVQRNWKKNKTLQKAINGVVNKDGIQWNIDNITSSKIPWDILLKYKESPKIILVYQGPNQVYYFFNHFFENEDKWEQFRNIVSTKLPRK